MSRVSKLSPSFRFPHQIPLEISLFPHMWYIPLQFILVCLITNIIWRGLQIVKLAIMSFSWISGYFLPLSFRNIPQHPVRNKSCAYILLLTSYTKFHTLIRLKAKL
jgi:hypothetical protein